MIICRFAPKGAPILFFFIYIYIYIFIFIFFFFYSIGLHNVA